MRTSKISLFSLALVVCLLLVFYVSGPFSSNAEHTKSDFSVKPTSLRHEAQNDEAQRFHPAIERHQEAQSETQHLADGCKHIFLDLGSNTGSTR